MLRLRLVLCVGIGIAGCSGPTIPGLPGGDQRLEPSDHLRAVCWFLSDNDIRGQLAAVEASRESGTTYAEAIATVAVFCDWAYLEFGAPDEVCKNCWYEIVDQIYGY